jgi:hypothetical protein
LCPRSICRWSPSSANLVSGRITTAGRRVGAGTQPAPADGQDVIIITLGNYLHLHELLQIKTLILFMLVIPAFVLRELTDNFSLLRSRKGALRCPIGCALLRMRCARLYREASSLATGWPNCRLPHAWLTHPHSLRTPLRRPTPHPDRNREGALDRKGPSRRGDRAARGLPSARTVFDRDTDAKGNEFLNIRLKRNLLTAPEYFAIMNPVVPVPGVGIL